MPRLRAIAASVLMLVAARGARGQYVYLDYVVTEDDFVRLLDDMELQGLARDDARALWGRLWFDLSHGLEASQAFEQWHNRWWDEWQEILGQPEWWESDPHPWDYQLHDSNFRREQRALTTRFYAELRAMAPHAVPAIDAHERAVRRRAVWRLRAVNRATFDLFEILDELQRKHPEFAFDPALWPEPGRSALRDYELALDALVIEIDRAYLERRDRRRRFVGPDQDSDRAAWVEEWTRWFMVPNELEVQFRELQTTTAQRLGSFLDTEAARLLVDATLARTFPFAWKKLAWEFWMQAALERRDLEPQVRAALRDLRTDLILDKRRRASELVKMYEATYRQDAVEADWRHSLERRAGLRDDRPSPVTDEAAYKNSLREYAIFDERAVERIRQLLGDRADSMAGFVLAQISAHEEETSWQGFSIANRLGNEASEAVQRPRERSPFITAGEFARIVDRVSPPGDQRRPVLLTLFEDFESVFAIARDQYDRERLVALEKDRRENLTAEEREQSPASQGFFDDWNRRWLDLRRRVEAEFADQVRALLVGEEERRLWEEAIRRSHRIRVIPLIRDYAHPARALLCHDLIDVLDKIGLIEHDAPALRVLIENLEIEIDEALTEFENRDTPLAREYYALHWALRENPNNAQQRRQDAVHKEWLRVRGRLIELRLQYVPAILELLDDDEKTLFTAALNRAGFPWLYDETLPDRVFAAVRRDRVLNAESEARLDAIARQYKVDMDAFRRDYLAVVPGFLVEEDPTVLDRLRPAVHAVAARRATLDRDACAAIRDLIPDDHFDDLALDIRLLLSSYN